MNISEIPIKSPKFGIHYLAGFRYNSNLGIFENFCNYLTMQEGGLSNYGLDLAAGNVPPEKYIDGKFYHTNRGWTWPTWFTKAKKYRYPLRGRSYSQAFYTMTVSDSDWMKKQYFNEVAQISDNELINTFYFYIIWGGSKNWNSWYFNVSGKNFTDSLKNDSDEIIFENMIKARLNNLAASSALYKSDAEKIKFIWLGAIAIFYREFSNQLKKK